MADPLESKIQNDILLEFGRQPDLKLWRQNTGVAKSEVVTRAHLERLFSLLTTHRNENSFKSNVLECISLIRSLLAQKPSFTRYGLCNGSSDIIGICQTRDCIHREARSPDSRCSDKFGIFVAWEIKRPGKKPTDEQQMFLDIINQMGGVGDCIHSVEEAQASYERARTL